MPFEFIKTEIDDLILIKPVVFKDNRGYFFESYKKSDFIKNGLDLNFVQENNSKSSKNVLRGLHFQAAPFAQGKLVRCLKGKILDCAVDLRQKSKTFKKWQLFELSDENKFSLFIPQGFAHGFVTLSETAEINYKVTGGEYNKASERGIIYNDKELNIDWGIDFTPILSEKDKLHPAFEDLSKEDLF